MRNVGQCSFDIDPDWFLSPEEIVLRDSAKHQQTVQSPTPPAAQVSAPTPLDPFQHLKARDVCRILNISPRTLAEWQRKGIMPHIKIGRAVRYRVADIKAALERYRIA